MWQALQSLRAYLKLCYVSLCFKKKGDGAAGLSRQREGRSAAQPAGRAVAHPKDIHCPADVPASIARRSLRAKGGSLADRHMGEGVQASIDSWQHALLMINVRGVATMATCALVGLTGLILAAVSGQRSSAAAPPAYPSPSQPAAAPPSVLSGLLHNVTSAIAAEKHVWSPAFNLPLSVYCVTVAVSLLVGWVSWRVNVFDSLQWRALWQRSALPGIVKELEPGDEQMVGIHEGELLTPPVNFGRSSFANSTTVMIAHGAGAGIVIPQVGGMRRGMTLADGVWSMSLSNVTDGGTLVEAPAWAQMSVIQALRLALFGGTAPQATGTEVGRSSSLNQQPPALPQQPLALTQPLPALPQQPPVLPQQPSALPQQPAAPQGAGALMSAAVMPAENRTPAPLGAHNPPAHVESAVHARVLQLGAGALRSRPPGTTGFAAAQPVSGGWSVPRFGGSELAQDQVPHALACAPAHLAALGMAYRAYIVADAATPGSIAGLLVQALSPGYRLFCPSLPVLPQDGLAPAPGVALAASSVMETCGAVVLVGTPGVLAHAGRRAELVRAALLQKPLTVITAPGVADLPQLQSADFLPQWHSGASAAQRPPALARDDPVVAYVQSAWPDRILPGASTYNRAAASLATAVAQLAGSVAGRLGLPDASLQLMPLPDLRQLAAEAPHAPADLAFLNCPRLQHLQLAPAASMSSSSSSSGEEDGAHDTCVMHTLETVLSGNTTLEALTLHGLSASTVPAVCDLVRSSSCPIQALHVSIRLPARHPQSAALSSAPLGTAPERRWTQSGAPPTVCSRAGRAVRSEGGGVPHHDHDKVA